MRLAPVPWPARLAKARTTRPINAPPLKASVAVRMARSTRRERPIARDFAIELSTCPRRRRDRSHPACILWQLDLRPRGRRRGRRARRTAADLHGRQAARLVMAREGGEIADRYRHNIIEECGRRGAEIAGA